jgi:hypothetical protein
MGRLCAVMAKPLQKYWNLIFLRVEWCLFRQYSLLQFVSRFLPRRSQVGIRS